MLDPNFKSIFKNEFNDLITFKRSMGYQYSDKYARSFIPLDKFFNKMHLTKKEITEEVYNAWCQKRNNESPNNYAYRYYKLKVFTDYLKQNNYKNVYFKELKITPQVQISIHIFSREEFEQILYFIDHYEHSVSSQNKAISIIFRMLYSCGFRISELLDLKINNIDLNKGTVIISNGKNYVTRCVPISDSLLKILKNYIETTKFQGEYLFFKLNGNKMKYYDVYKVFKYAINKYNNKFNKLITARIHDIRHSFISYNYKKLIDMNYNVYNALLLISKYVGHKGIKEVEYYIKAINMEDDTLTTNCTKEMFGDIK